MPVNQNDWQEPGVRISNTTESEDDNGTLSMAALPVFIGWGEGSTQPRTVSSSGDIVNSDTLPVSVRSSVRLYFDNGGSPCFLLMVNAKTPTGLDGWQALFRQAALALPPDNSLMMVALPQLTGDADGLPAAVPLTDVWKSLLQAFADRPGVFFVLDTPQDLHQTQLCLTQLRDSPISAELAPRAALYGPHLVTDYPAEGSGHVRKVLNTDYQVLPPCGAVLACYSRTDNQEGVWKAPANVPLSRVSYPEYAEWELKNWLNPAKASANVIRSFTGRGTRVWGARTLASPASSATGYVQVRRTLSWIEASLQQLCRFALFEPNQDIIWFQLRGLCSAWLRRLWLAGGLAGHNETSAYSVKVGLNESMTAEDIAQGKMIVQVGVALIRPAEFITLTLVLKTGTEQQADHSQTEEAIL